MMRVSALVLFGNLILMGLHLFYYSDTKELKEVPIKKNVILGCINLSTTLVGACNTERYDVLLIFLLLMDGIVLVSGEKQKEITHMVLKIFSYIVLMLLSEIMGVYFFCKYLESAGKSLEEFYQDVLLSFLLGMCLISILHLDVNRVFRTKNKVQKIVWCLAGIQVMEKIFTLHVSAFFTLSDESYMKDILIYIPFLVVDYVIYILLVSKFEVRSMRTVVEGSKNNFYEYYTALEAEHREIRKMYHDIKNLIMIYQQSGELENLAECTLNQLEAINQFPNTGSSALDIILYNGKRMAMEKQIEFEVIISEGTFSFMDENDLSRLFSNVILNAIEACEKVTDGPRKIQIKAGVNEENVMLYISNTISQNQKKSDFVTDKEDKKYHGIGMISVQETVERYNGFTSVIEKSNFLQLAIIFSGNYMGEANEG